MEPGDIVFIVVEKKHEVFKRNGNDLVMEYNLQLIEALAGFAFTVKHLDDRVLHVQSAKGDVVKPGMFPLSSPLSLFIFSFSLCLDNIANFYSSFFYSSFSYITR